MTSDLEVEGALDSYYHTLKRRLVCNDNDVVLMTCGVSLKYEAWLASYRGRDLCPVCYGIEKGM